jgi:hypothetical protein
MFNDAIIAVEKEVVQHEKNATSDESMKITRAAKVQFTDILCPKNHQTIDSSVCEQCPHKISLKRKHPLGYTLTSLVCKWTDEAKEG